jgi:S-adenosylmethionine synthetase
MQRQAEVRKDGRLPWLRPDAKSQVTLRYVDGKPVAIDTVVLSTQHRPGRQARPDLRGRDRARSSSRCCRRNCCRAHPSYLVNPTGRS